MENFSIKINENVRLRLYKICRLCGDDNPNNTDILANNKKSTNVDPDFHKKIFDCIGIQVTKGDKMPQTACNMCREKINDFFDFREMCLATDIQTRRLLGLPETVIPKPDPSLDAIEDDKTEVEKTIKKKNPVAIKALKSGKALKSEKRSSVELRKGTLVGRKALSESRRMSLHETRRSSLTGDIKKVPPDIKKGPQETRKNQLDIKKGPPETRRSLLEGKSKSKIDLKKIPVDTKKSLVEIKKPADVKKLPPEGKKSSSDLKKTASDVKKSTDGKKVGKLEREKVLFKLKKKVQISVQQLSDADLAKKFKDDPERLARAQKRKASGGLLTEKPPNKRERLRDNIIRKFNNPEIALDNVPTNVTCKICGKPFCNAGELHRHLDTDHLPRIVTFHCIRCNESLEKKQDIKDHNLWHKLSKTPYECGRCTKTITNLAVYTKHVQNCSGFVQDFEYKTKSCTICKEEFPTQNLYNWHKCVINQLKCEVCQQKFIKRGAMIRHVVRCSAIGLTISLPVVHSAIQPDPEPETESQLDDHFGDGDDSGDDDAEMNLKPDMEIDIEVPRANLDEPEDEEKRVAPFVVIPTQTTANSEISRPSSNSSSSVLVANSISSRTASVHSNNADDDASNASTVVQMGTIVAPMVCIKRETALRCSISADSNERSVSNSSVRVKDEVIDSAYRESNGNNIAPCIKEEQEDPSPAVEASAEHSTGGAMSDDMDDPNDDIPDDRCSSPNESPPCSPRPSPGQTPEPNATTLPKPTLKLVIKKQHGTLNSSFVAGSDVPSKDNEPQPKKKKKKKAKIFKIPKGLALRLKQDKIQEGNDDASSGTNNENEEDDVSQDGLPIISNVCSKYVDGIEKNKNAEDISAPDIPSVRIKQETIENDIEVNPVNENTNNVAIDNVEVPATENSLPVISEVFSKHSKKKGKVKNPPSRRLSTTVQIKQEILDNERDQAIDDSGAEKQVTEIRIKQERPDEESVSNIPEKEATEIERTNSDANKSTTTKSPHNVKKITRYARPKRNEQNIENTIVANVQIKQERLDPEESTVNTNVQIKQERLDPEESTAITSPSRMSAENTQINESNEDQQSDNTPPNRSVIRNSKLPKGKRKEVKSAKEKVPDTNVRIKQERLDSDDPASIQTNLQKESTNDLPENLDINLEKNRRRSLRNKEVPDLNIRVKEERIDRDEHEETLTEKESTPSDESAVDQDTDEPSTIEQATAHKDKEVRVKQEPLDSREHQDSDESNSGDTASAQNDGAVRIKQEHLESDEDQVIGELPSRNPASAQKESEVRIKQEHMDSDEHEPNSDEQTGIVTTIATTKKSKAKSSKLKMPNKNRKIQPDIVPPVDENIRIKEEKEPDTVNPVTSVTTTMPVISEVFSQRVKTEVEDNVTLERSVSNTTQENVRIKAEKEDDDVCIIDSDDENDEVVEAETSDIPFISLLSPDRSDANSELPSNEEDSPVRVKQERRDTPERSISRKNDNQNVTNVTAASLSSKKASKTPRKDKVNENVVDKSIHIKQEIDNGRESIPTSAQKKANKEASSSKPAKKSVPAEKPTMILPDKTNLTAKLSTPQKNIEVPIKEERLDEDDDVQLVDFTEIIEIPDENVPATSPSPPKSKRPKIHKESITLEINPASRVNIREETTETEEPESNLFNPSTTVINPLAARLKRLSRKRKNINPLNPANLGALQTRIKRERVDSQDGSDHASRTESPILVDAGIVENTLEHIRVKEEPVERTSDQILSKPDNSLAAKDNPSQITRKKKSTIHESVKKTVGKASEVIQKIVVPSIADKVNKKDLPTKKADGSSGDKEEPRPILRIKSEFTSLNFGDVENERATNESPNARAVVLQKETLNSDIVIKNEPVFEVPIKEEVEDDECEVESEDNDTEIKSEPEDSDATEDIQSSLSKEQHDPVMPSRQVENALYAESCVISEKVPNYDPITNEVQIETENSQDTSISKDNVEELPAAGNVTDALDSTRTSLVTCSATIMSPEGKINQETDVVLGEPSKSAHSSNVEEPTVIENSTELVELTDKPTITDSSDVSNDSTIELGAVNQSSEDQKNNERPNEHQKESDALQSEPSTSTEPTTVGEPYIMATESVVPIEPIDLSDATSKSTCDLDTEKQPESTPEKLSPNIENLEATNEQDDKSAKNETEANTNSGNDVCRSNETEATSGATDLSENLNVTAIDDKTSCYTMPGVETISNPCHEFTAAKDSEVENSSQVEKMDVDDEEATNFEVDDARSKDSLSASFTPEPEKQVLMKASSNLMDVDCSPESSAALNDDTDSGNNVTTSGEPKVDDKLSRALLVPESDEPIRTDATINSLPSIEKSPHETSSESSESQDENSENLSETSQEVQKQETENIEYENKDPAKENNLSHMEIDDSKDDYGSDEEDATNEQQDQKEGMEENVDNVQNDSMDDASQSDEIVENNEQSLSAEGGKTLDSMENQETESDDKISDFDNVTQESENADGCNEREDLGNIEDDAENDSSSNCNQKLKDLIQDKNNLLGFFEHELSRNNDSSSVEETMRQTICDAENSNEVREDLKEGTRPEMEHGGTEKENVLGDDIAGTSEERCTNDSSESLVAATDSVSRGASIEEETTGSAIESRGLPLCSEASQNALDPNTISNSLTPVKTDSALTSTSTIQQSSHQINPPVNFSINTLIGPTIVPTSSNPTTTVAPSITALPKAIVSPAISPSMSSYNTPQLNSFDRISNNNFSGSLNGSDTFSNNPAPSLHPIESSNSLNSLSTFVSSNLNNQLPSPCMFPTTSVQSTMSNSFHNRSPLDLHLNEIAENINNANIERELQNDLESISSNSNLDFDENTVNSVSDASEQKV